MYNCLHFSSLPNILYSFHFSVATLEIGTQRKKNEIIALVQYVHQFCRHTFFSYLIRKCDATIRLFEFFRFKIVTSLLYSAISIFRGTFRSDLTRSPSIFTITSNYGFDIGIFVIRTWQTCGLDSFGMLFQLDQNNVNASIILEISDRFGLLSMTVYECTFIICTFRIMFRKYEKV